MSLDVLAAGARARVLARFDPTAAEVGERFHELIRGDYVRLEARAVRSGAAWVVGSARA